MAIQLSNPFIKSVFFVSCSMFVLQVYIVVGAAGAQISSFHLLLDRLTDRQTDGPTDGFTCLYTSFCMFL